ncbi:MAG TPA: dTDP-4-amino-4,6-dideoxygalactose transaminase [Candidatus Methylacidiphilales bacterium]
MKVNSPIPFNKACLAGREKEYMQDALARGHIAGNGDYTKRCEALLEKTVGVSRALLTTSCTHALEMTGLLLDLQPGDEVILPSFTFVSTANAYALRGARLVFCDIRPDTLNLDERILPALITPRTKAIVVVHYGGVGCAMNEIMDICQRRGVALIEDNAHGLFGKYQGRQLGTFGAMSTLSFHETKNFTCGEGGALLINDAKYVERAEIIREKGTNRARFFRGLVDKYTWVEVGSSYVVSDLLAGMLLGQLEAREEIQGRRKAVWERYQAAFHPWKGPAQMVTPTVPVDCGQAYHLYYLLLTDVAARDRFIGESKAAGMTCPFHYVPLHLSPAGLRMGGRESLCPVTENISPRLVRLPFYGDLTREEQERVIDLVLKFK